MKPTACILFVVGVVLAISAALLYMSSSSYSADSNGVQADAGRSPTLMFALLAAAAGIGALVWAMLRFGGKGYTETNSPLRR